MLRVDQLCKHYGTRRAVDELTLHVAPGEVVGLLGPNGAGKTTTLRSISGMIRPTSGSISIAGHDLQQAPMDAKRALGFIPDEPQLFDLLTVDEHLDWMARLYQVTEVGTRRSTLYERLDLVGRGSELPGALSRGMRQKVAVACGLLSEPSVVLFDEPLTGLDPRAIRTIKELMREHADRGAAVVVSSHLLSLVEEIADSVLILSAGQTVFRGTLEELRAQSRPGASLEDVFMTMTGATPA